MLTISKIKIKEYSYIRIGGRRESFIILEMCHEIILIISKTSRARAAVRIITSFIFVICSYQGYWWINVEVW